MVKYLTREQRESQYLVVSVDDRMPQVCWSQADGQLVRERDLIPRVKCEKSQEKEKNF